MYNFTYNSITYNDSVSLIIISGANFEGVGLMTSVSSVVYSGEFILEGIGTFIPGIPPDIIEGGATFIGIGTMTVEALRRVLKQLTITGMIQPYDHVVIDMDRMTITINGQNALSMMDGNFWDLLPGENIVEYTDDEVSRNLRMVTRYRDRWA